MTDEAQVDGGEVLDAIRAAGRKVLPLHTYLAHNDPAALAGFNQFLTSTIYDNDSLPEAYKEIVLACACVAAGSGQPVIAAHCRKALAAGASRGEVLQALEITAAVFATRAMGAGVMAMLEVEGE
jgi:alkylhydroperoxidase/carboxymuconolactone decarboxylase family protein YurZ